MSALSVQELREFWEKLRLPPFWKSRSLRVAAGLVGFGLILWLLRPGAEISSSRSLPLPLRLGLSYIGGFLVGWAIRHFVRFCFWLGLVLALVFVVLRLSGCLPSSGLRTLESSVSKSVTLARHEAESFRQQLRRFLPSTAAATLGMLLGARRRWTGSVPLELWAWHKRRAAGSPPATGSNLTPGA